MKAKLITPLALVAVLLALCAPLFAHHGNVAYDNKTLVTVKDAVVTKISWANPHILIQFDAKDDSGAVQHWVMESGSPSLNTAQGWTNTTVQPGDTITVYLYQVKTGRPVGRLSKRCSPMARHLAPADNCRIASPIATTNRSTAAMKRRPAVPTGGRRPTARNSSKARRQD